MPTPVGGSGYGHTSTPALRKGRVSVSCTHGPGGRPSLLSNVASGVDATSGSLPSTRGVSPHEPQRMDSEPLRHDHPQGESPAPLAVTRPEALHSSDAPSTSTREPQKITEPRHDHINTPATRHDPLHTNSVADDVATSKGKSEHPRFDSNASLSRNQAPASDDVVSVERYDQGVSNLPPAIARYEKTVHSVEATSSFREPQQTDELPRHDQGNNITRHDPSRSVHSDDNITSSLRDTREKKDSEHRHEGSNTFTRYETVHSAEGATSLKEPRMDSELRQSNAPLVARHEPVRVRSNSVHSADDNTSNITMTTTTSTFFEHRTTHIASLATERDATPAFEASAALTSPDNKHRLSDTSKHTAPPPSPAASPREPKEVVDTRPSLESTALFDDVSVPRRAVHNRSVGAASPAPYKGWASEASPPQVSPGMLQARFPDIYSPLSENKKTEPAGQHSNTYFDLSQLTENTETEEVAAAVEEEGPPPTLRCSLSLSEPESEHSGDSEHSIADSSPTVVRAVDTTEVATQSEVHTVHKAVSCTDDFSCTHCNNLHIQLEVMTREKEVLNKENHTLKLRLKNIQSSIISDLMKLKSQSEATPEPSTTPSVATPASPPARRSPVRRVASPVRRVASPAASKRVKSPSLRRRDASPPQSREKSLPTPHKSVPEARISDEPLPTPAPAPSPAPTPTPNSDPPSSIMLPVELFKASEVVKPGRTASAAPIALHTKLDFKKLRTLGVEAYHEFVHAFYDGNVPKRAPELELILLQEDTPTADAHDVHETVLRLLRDMSVKSRSGVLLRVFGMTAMHGALYAVAERCSTTSTLQEYVHRRRVTGSPFTQGEVVVLAKAILTGLGEIHAHCAHRDLSSLQVMITNDPYITSFTTVKLRGYGLTRAPPLLEFTSPESIVSRSFSKENDMWSFGAVMYEVVTYGMVQAFAGETQAEIKKEVLKKFERGQELFTRPSSVSSMLWEQLFAPCFLGAKRRTAAVVLAKQIDRASLRTDLDVPMLG